MKDKKKMILLIPSTFPPPNSQYWLAIILVFKIWNTYILFCNYNSNN